MWVVVYNPETNEEYHRSELDADDMLVERDYAQECADIVEQELDDSDGYIPNCCGDIRVEFREDPDNGLHIWSGESFYFKGE